MSKRKLPESISDAVAAAESLPATAIDLIQQSAKKPAQMLSVAGEAVTPPRRIAPIGSPADIFVQKSPNQEKATMVSSHIAV
jgi:hypothetical protein